MTLPRENIQRLAAYAPGEQPEAGAVIKLNTNESPYPPSPKVLAAIAEVTPEALRRYPSPTAAGFRAAAAKTHGLTGDQVIATNGGDELLRLILTTWCSASGQDGAGGIGITNPTYSLYPVLAGIHDTPVCVVERGDGFVLPSDTADRWNTAGCAVGFLVNPHAPTGQQAGLDALRSLAEQFNGLLVIDEAYVDFSNDSAVALLTEGLDNVMLLRSLSKGYGLAGLRFGYGLSHRDNIAALDKARDSYNTDALAQAAAVAAIEDQPYARACWAKVVAERERMAGALRERGFAVPESGSNFLLAACMAYPDNPQGADARTLYQSLKRRGILVRYFDAPRLDDKLRITVGTPDQNNRLLHAIDDLLQAPRTSM